MKPYATSAYGHSKSRRRCARGSKLLGLRSILQRVTRVALPETRAYSLFVTALTATRFGSQLARCEHCETVAVCRLRGSIHNVAEWGCEKCAPDAFKEGAFVTIANRVAGFVVRTMVLAWLAATLAYSVPRSRIADLTVPDLVVGIFMFLLTILAIAAVFRPVGGDYAKAYYIWGSITPGLVYGLAVAAFFGWLLYQAEPIRPYVVWLLLKVLDVAIPGAG